MFESTLKRLVERIEGARGAALLSTDGLVIEAVDGAGRAVEGDDAAREYAAVFKQLLAIGEAIDLGEVTRFTVEGDAQCTLVRVLTPNYLVALNAPADVITGKAHFALRTAAPDLAREL